MVLMNDFKRQWEDCRTEVAAAIDAVGSSGWYILGGEVERFEQALAEYWGLGHAVGVANGMDALEIGLRCLGLRPGDKVLTTPLTAFATTLAIMRAGGFPLFLDVDANGQIDIDRCRQALRGDPSIRMLLPVHLFGLATTLPALRELAGEFDIWVLEDCAQSIGAADGQMRAGCVGTIAATSFYPTKNLGALGDGGALLTNNTEIAWQARRLRNYGQSSQYVHDELGLNSRLDELHAAVLRRAFLPRLPRWTDRRRAIAEAYLGGIRSRHVQLLEVQSRSQAVWHLFPVLVPPQRRDAFRAFLKDGGVASGIHYPTLVPDQAAMPAGRFSIIGELTKARQFAASEVSLPIHPYLSDAEVEQVVAACNRWTG